MAGYRYNYKALSNAASTGTAFKPLSEVKDDSGYKNMATALLEAKGITAGTDEANAFLAAATTAGGTNDSQIDAYQNIAGLTKSQVAAASGNKWAADDDHNIGRSYLQKIIDQGDSATATVEDLFTKGFGRASDASGKEYWDHRLAGTGDHGAAIGISEIAKSFLGSEESNLRDVYSSEYNRDADASGLAYWMDETEGDDSATLLKAVQHRSDDGYEQAETSIRDLFSKELGLHSTDAQREADVSLKGAGVGGSDIYTAANNETVMRMVKDASKIAESNKSQKTGVTKTVTNADGTTTQVEVAAADPLANAKSEIASKKKMQTAAQYMGDYADSDTDGDGVNDTTATNVHLMLAESEMGSIVDNASFGSGKEFVLDGAAKDKTADDYVNEAATTGWDLLKTPQTYTKADVDDVVTVDTGGPPGGNDNDNNNNGNNNNGNNNNGNNNNGNNNNDDDDNDDDDNNGDDTIIGGDDGTNIGGDDFVSDVDDTSTYSASKTTFDDTAAGIKAPTADMTIRDTGYMKAGGDARGVRLKRSKKFKSGESALGTKQFGRQLQIKSLNI